MGALCNDFQCRQSWIFTTCLKCNLPLQFLYSHISRTKSDFSLFGQRWTQNVSPKWEKKRFKPSLQIVHVNPLIHSGVLFYFPPINDTSHPLASVTRGNLKCVKQTLDFKVTQEMWEHMSRLIMTSQRHSFYPRSFLRCLVLADYHSPSRHAITPASLLHLASRLHSASPRRHSAWYQRRSQRWQMGASHRGEEVSTTEGKQGRVYLEGTRSASDKT